MAKQRGKASIKNLKQSTMWGKMWWRRRCVTVVSPPPSQGVRRTGLPSACHSGGGVGGRGEEGSQCWPRRGCPGCVAPSPSSPEPSGLRRDGCSAASSSSSIAGCCRCPCSRRTSQLYPWGGKGLGLVKKKLELLILICQFESYEQVNWQERFVIFKYIRCQQLFLGCAHCLS